MSEDKKDSESTRNRWDRHADTYDEWYETFEGAVEHYVDWELLKGYLPKNGDAKILDAAGGTGRITLLLAKMGFQVTLCDISPRMLDVARRKLHKGGVSDRVRILECDVRSFPFADESFDFVLCWDGMIEALKEFVRVTKKRGKMSIFLVNKGRAAIDRFHEDPRCALALMNSAASYVSHDEEEHGVANAEEATKLFEAEGIRVLNVYAVCGWMDVLGIPEKVLHSRTWSKELFRQTTEMVSKLSNEPSVCGMSRHLVLYGERI